LGLICLPTRRTWSDLIDTYKITNGKTELFFDYDQSGRRGHSKKLFKRKYNNNNNNKQICKAPCMPTEGCRGAEIAWISESLHLVTE